jgi:hypothetical protein
MHGAGLVVGSTKILHGKAISRWDAGHMQRLPHLASIPGRGESTICYSGPLTRRFLLMLCRLRLYLVHDPRGTSSRKHKNLAW